MKNAVTFCYSPGDKQKVIVKGNLKVEIVDPILNKSPTYQMIEQIEKHRKG